MQSIYAYTIIVLRMAISSCGSDFGAGPSGPSAVSNSGSPQSGAGTQREGLVQTWLAVATTLQEDNC